MQQAQDPIIQMQQQELQIKMQELQLKVQKQQVDAAAKADQLKIVDAIPAGVVNWRRGWDLGATIGGDYTAGAKIGALADGRYIIADVARDQLETNERDQLIKNAADRDGRGAVTQDIPQDPGQAGKTQVLALVRMLAGFTVKTSPETGDKVTRAEPLAAQVNVGNVLMLKGTWNEALIEEMRLFPNGQFSDQIDGLSRAFAELLSASDPTPAGASIQGL